MESLIFSLATVLIFGAALAAILWMRRSEAAAAAKALETMRANNSDTLRVLSTSINLLSSKDPMTFQAIQAMMPVDPSLTPDAQFDAYGVPLTPDEVEVAALKEQGILSDEDTEFYSDIR